MRARHALFHRQICPIFEPFSQHRFFSTPGGTHASLHFRTGMLQSRNST